MTTKVVTDKQWSAFCRRHHEIHDRMRAGTLNAELVLAVQQQLIDGQSVKQWTKNPFELSVTEQLARVYDVFDSLRMRMEPDWDLQFRNCNEVLDRLERQAPPWPEGQNAFRFLQIRDACDSAIGVRNTFHAHRTILKMMLGEQYDPQEGVFSTIEDWAISLREYDSITSEPLIRWVYAAMDPAPTCTILGKPRQLADELLAFAWQFPEYLRAIDGCSAFPLIGGGYKIETVRTLHRDDVLVICRSYLGDGRVTLFHDRLENGVDEDVVCSVPRLLQTF